MLSIQDLSQRFGISEKSVRRRLDSLKPVLDQHLTTGRQNAILLKDSGIAIFDRVMQLEQQDKLSPSAALEKVISEVGKGFSEVSKDEQGVVQSIGQAVPAPNEELVEVLKQQVSDLRNERDRLLGIIENQNEQMQAMLPGSTEEPPPSEKRSRWSHLKAVVTGR